MIEIGGQYSIPDPSTDHDDGWQGFGSVSDASQMDAGLGDDRMLLASGRGALRAVIADVLAGQPTRPQWTAYLPSYCCQAVIDPFLAAGIHLKFYSVEYHADSGLTAHVDPDVECDIVLATSFFGFGATRRQDASLAFMSRGVTTIEDVTHSWLSEEPATRGVHYRFVSLRKWFPVPTGGIAVKRTGQFSNANREPGRIDAAMMLEAMRQKGRYLQGERVSKQEFLNHFSTFNQKLDESDKSLSCDEYTERILARTDIEAIRATRRANAQVLLDGLSDIDWARPLVLGWDFEKDTPLFVPIIVDPRLRLRLLRHLRDNHIYCPVHWPMPSVDDELVRFTSIYNRALSLVCDHRYSRKDMERVVSVLQGFGI